MKVSELAERIGQVGYLRTDTFRIPVRIFEVKISYGEPRYLVSPEGGWGEAWVNASRVGFSEELWPLPKVFAVKN